MVLWNHNSDNIVLLKYNGNWWNSTNVSILDGLKELSLAPDLVVGRAIFAAQDIVGFCSAAETAISRYARTVAAIEFRVASDTRADRGSHM